MAVFSPWTIVLLWISLLASDVFAGIYLPKREYIFRTLSSPSPGQHIGTIYCMEHEFIKCDIADTLVTIVPSVAPNDVKLSSSLSKQRLFITAETVPDNYSGTIRVTLQLGCRKKDSEPSELLYFNTLWNTDVVVEIIAKSKLENLVQNAPSALDEGVISELLCPNNADLLYDVIENGGAGSIDTFEGFKHFTEYNLQGFDVRIALKKRRFSIMSVDSNTSVLNLAMVLDRESKFIPKPRFTLECSVFFQDNPLSFSPMLRDVRIRIVDLDDNPPQPDGLGGVINIYVNENKKVTKHIHQLVTIDNDSTKVTNDNTYHVTSNDTYGVIDLDTVFEKMRPNNKSVIKTTVTVIGDVSRIPLPYDFHVTLHDVDYKPRKGQPMENNKVIHKLRILPEVKGLLEVRKSNEKTELNIAATKYALVIKLKSERDVKNPEWKVVHVMPDPFRGIVDVTSDGEVYVANQYRLSSYVMVASPILTIALSSGGIRREEFSLTIQATDNGDRSDDMDCNKDCFQHTTEDTCASSCGYGAPDHQCVWDDEMCTPNPKTCPDRVCSVLEKMNEDICPQDCDNLSNVTDETPQPGISYTIDQCLCKGQIQCDCQAEQPEPNDSSPSGGNEALQEAVVAETSKCNTLCRIGVISAVLAILVAIVAAVAGRAFWKKRQEQRQLPSLKPFGSLVSMSAIPSDYVVDDLREAHRGHGGNRSGFTPASSPWNLKTTGGSYHENIEDEWEFPRENLSLENIIGEGEFGQVMKAKAITEKGQDSKVVAVKMLKPDASGTEYQDLLSEYQMLKEVNHPNVIKLLGVCSQKGPLLVIVEYCELGSLRSFLRASGFKNKGSWEEKQRSGNPFSQGQDVTTTRVLTSRDLFTIAWQISKGMDYLAGLKIVHRDLAARNVLVKEGLQVKISDFGLSRDVYEANTYLKMSKGRIPVKWMAPESLYGQIYTTKSDTWSYGIVLWEIVTLGASPYPGIPPEKLFDLLNTGYRMDRPEDCPEELYALMQKCWKSSPEDRPRFATMRDILDRILQQNTDYLELPDNNHVGPFEDFISFRKQVSRDKNPRSTPTPRLRNDVNKSLNYQPTYGNIPNTNNNHQIVSDTGSGGSGGIGSRHSSSSSSTSASSEHSTPQWHDDHDNDSSDRESCPESSKLLLEAQEETTKNNLYENSVNVTKPKQSNIIFGNNGNKQPNTIYSRSAVHENLTYV